MTTSQSTMNRSWLVQRLEKPHGAFGVGLVDNPFNFGGGLHNGGLSEDAMKMFRPIFSFDYMGATEFEWGAVPKAFLKMAKVATDLAATQMSIPYADVKQDWRAEKDKTPRPAGDATIFLLCRHSDVSEVSDRVKQWATGPERLKEMTRLSSTLLPYSEWDGRVQGWLELDNGFMFFTDEAMWAAVCDIFGVTR